MKKNNVIIWIEKSISAICDKCGEVGFFICAKNTDEANALIARDFFCPACGLGVELE